MTHEFLLDDRVDVPGYKQLHSVTEEDDDDSLLTPNDLDIEHLLYSSEDEGEHDDQKEPEPAVNAFYLKLGYFLTRWPHRRHPGSVIIIEVLLTLLVVCVVLCAKYHPPSNFINDLKGDPTLGFTTRGTEIVKAMWTAKKLYYSVVWTSDAKYSPYPNETLALKNLGLDPLDFAGWLTTTTKSPTSSAPSTTTTTTPVPIPGPSAGYSPMGDWLTYMLFAFEPKSKNVDLWSVYRIREICHLVKEKILPTVDSDMSHVVSLGTIIGSVYNKQCRDLTKADVKHFRSMFKTCVAYGIPVEEDEDESMEGTTSAPPRECTQYAAQMHDVKRFILPEHQSKSAKAVTERLSTTVVFISAYAPNSDTGAYYNNVLYKKSIESEHVKVTGFRCQDKDLKLHIYEEYMLDDTYLFGLAILFVFIIMFAYLRRVDVLFATIIMIIMSLVFSYTIFYFVLRLKFFPAINFLAILIIIAVGSDDVFVFYDLFQQTTNEFKSQPLEVIIAKTFHHAVLSLFVTSFTTSAAFFSNTVSNITNIRIFGIFAGTAILVNFVTMILFVPSVVVAVELLMRPCQSKCSSFNKCSDTLSEKLGYISKAIFARILPKIIENCWHICIILFSILGTVSFILVFVKPGFQLPVSDDFQVFKSSNVMEHWDLILSGKYLFTQEKYDYKLLHPFYIFGFKADDPGDHLNPKDDSGELTVDEDFDLYPAKTQMWMKETCHKFKEAPFARKKYMDEYDCAFDAYETVAKNICDNPIYGYVLSKCCKTTQVPFDNLEDCLPVYQALAHNKLNIPGVTHYPKQILDVIIFNPKNNRVAGYILNIKTNWYNSYNYEIMGHYYKATSDFFEHIKHNGPETIQHGFMAYTSWVWFWDLQNALYVGTYYSICMSLAVSTVVMLVTSLNVLITIYAMITIAMAIASTVAAIVLMGWSLSVIESVIISLSVGLSIDFTIHYGVAYRLSNKKTPNERVQDSFKTVGAAVFMAALTTLCSGAAIMLCRVLPYIKLGTFLIIVMTFAWFYATFLFQSICRIIGPRGNFCQIRIPTRCKKAANSDLHTQSSRIQLAQVEDDVPLIL